ncbi:flagellar motor switch protein FliG [Spirochaetota bacterium]|nr:flagellar motor switch protein FliG [Spirochaetota bacterium]
MAESEKQRTLSIKNASGRKKAAIFLVSLGSQNAASIMKHLKDEEVEGISFEIARLSNVSLEDKNIILKEFYELIKASRHIIAGGIDYATEILEAALGSQRASEIINRLTSSLQIKPFDFIKNADAQHLVNLLQSEHPQTTALVLTYLEPKKSSEILSQLPVDIQTDVTRRIAIMDRTTPEVVREVESTLEIKLSSFESEDLSVSGGIDTAAEILNLVDRATEKTIIENLEEKDPALAEEIKKRMFVFEDIIILDDRSIQKVIRKVDMSDLTKALKSVDEEVKEKILTNMSKRAAVILSEDIEFLGPIKIADMEQSQQRIVNVIRKMEEEGEILIVRAGEESNLV